MTPVDPEYVEARRVLLDALTALAAHTAALVVAGAQAVYLRTGAATSPSLPTPQMAISQSIRLRWHRILRSRPR